MRSTNANFDAKHDLDYKTPVYLIKFEDEMIDYCNHRPAPYSLASPTSRLCMLDGSAFAWVSEIDLNNFFGKKITLEDSTGKQAIGYIKEADAAEVLGAELVTNGDMELDDANWPGWNGPTTNERSSEQANGGTYSRKIITTTDNQYEGASQVVTLTVDKLYKVVGYLYLSSGNDIILFAYDATLGYKLSSIVGSTGSWIARNFYFTARATSTSIGFVKNQGASVTTFYCDDKSVKEVTNVGTDGVHIVSALGGSTRNWTSIDSGFDPNNIASLTINDTSKKYLASISSLSRKVIPEEGRSSISGITVRILDKDDEITSLISTDSDYFHRKKTTIKAGYAGLNEEEMLAIFTGWVTGLKLSSDGLVYEFSVTDPQKWMQRKVFRSASAASPVTVSGNPLNILLAVLLSTGGADSSAASDYDYLDAANGLGIDEDTIKVSAIEELRDSWFPGSSHYMNITIKKRIKAKDFFEQEIFKPLNLYPAIDGQGQFYVRRFTPPLPTVQSVQSFSEDNIVGLPGWDSNLVALINEVEFNYNWDVTEGKFDDEVLYINSTSINNRGPGKKSITIKSKGFHTDLSPGSLVLDVINIITRRKNAIFNRFSIPPLKLLAKTYFDRWLSEVGDIVPITHSKLPDIESGTRGLDETRMEVVSENVDFKSGRVKLGFLNTGFSKDLYIVISPSMVVVSGASSTQFTVSIADAKKYSNFTVPEVKVTNAFGVVKAASVTILTVNTSTGVITCDSIGETPQAGWLIAFSSYDNCTAEQKLYWFLSDGSGKLGAANDDEQLIIP